MMIVSERDRPFRLLLSGGLFVFLAIAVMQGSSLLLVVDDLGIQLAQKNANGPKRWSFPLDYHACQSNPRYRLGLSVSVFSLGI